MTKNEMRLVVGFLEELDDKFGSDGCNDMWLPNTPANRELNLAAEKFWRKVNEDEEESSDDPPEGDIIDTNNQVILGYLIHRLKKEHRI